MEDVLGREIHSCRDEWGTIRVFDDGQRRHLRFGERDEQTAVDMAEPWSLIYEYTQAMVLGALFVADPRRIIILGLGGGSLVHALRFLMPAAEIIAVERRQVVVDVAQEFFGLGELPGVDYVVEDADQFIRRAGKPADLLFADLYDEGGMCAAQGQDDFLRQCSRRLRAHGALVLNMWDLDTRANSRCIRVLREALDGGVLVCDTAEGSQVMFGLSDAAEWSPRHFVPVARRLGKKLGCPLDRRAASVRMPE